MLRKNIEKYRNKEDKKIWFRFTSEIKVEQENYHNEIFGIILHFLTIWLEKNDGYFFLLGGSSEP